MKKTLIVVIVIAVVVVIWPKPFTSSPGFVSAETYAQFEATKPTCYGYTYLTNREATFADAPGRSLCFGILTGSQK
ncbi:MAG TPA: hypothetical protein VHE10_03330 [Candidatus Paceibacterota bacterium]|nr:hypothetical protein [Candidatus Paceibacterota bacterium]